MAAGAFTLYSNACLEIGKGQMNLASDTFVIALINNSYTPAPNTDSLWSSVSADELTTANGYTAGGITLSQTFVLATATSTFSATSPAWTLFSAGPFRYGVIVRRAGGSLAGSDLLVCYSDLGGGSTITGSGGTFTISVSGSGIFAITHSP